MKRHVVTGLVLAALLLGGCSEERATTSAESEPEKKPEAAAVAKPKGAMTLEEVQQKVNFPVVMPDKLPHDLKFDHASVANGGVVLNFTSAEQKTALTVMQFPGSELPKLAPDEKELTVSGHKGSYVTAKDVAALSWTDGKMVYHLMTSASSELGQEAAMVEIGAAFARKM